MKDNWYIKWRVVTLTTKTKNNKQTAALAKMYGFKYQHSVPLLQNDLDGDQEIFDHQEKLKMYMQQYLLIYGIL